MTDKEIIEGLIGRDNRITAYFLEKYRPLFMCAIQVVFDYPVDVEECINELYLYLMKDDAAKLRAFEYRSTLGCWLKKVVIRFFRDLRISRRVIEDQTKEPLYEKRGEDHNDGDEVIDMLSADEAKQDMERLFTLMSNERYVSVIRALVLEDREPEQIARFMGVTVANLYNIKKRALAALAKVAINERRRYENK